MIRQKKSLGQNFLIDNNIINKIIESVNISNNDTVIEIGPGSGNLTKRLLSKDPKKFIVIEKDILLCQKLEKVFSKKIQILNEDFLKTKINIFQEKEIIVFGNLPYNISSQILIKLIKLQFSKIKFKYLILMFQKEVADRITAKINTKSYGRLSVISQWRMNIKKITDVNPKSFYPIPKVKSSLLLFTPKKEFYPLDNIESLEHVTKTFFNYRRKMVKKPLSILFRNKDEIAKENKLNLNDRPQNISPKIFYKLSNEYRF